MKSLILLLIAVGTVLAVVATGCGTSENNVGEADLSTTTIEGPVENTGTDSAEIHQEATEVITANEGTTTSSDPTEIDKTINSSAITTTTEEYEVVNFEESGSEVWQSKITGGTEEQDESVLPASDAETSQSEDWIPTLQMSGSVYLTDYEPFAFFGPIDNIKFDEVFLMKRSRQLASMEELVYDAIFMIHDIEGNVVRQIPTVIGCPAILFWDESEPNPVRCYFNIWLSDPPDYNTISMQLSEHGYFANTDEKRTFDVITESKHAPLVSILRPKTSDDMSDGRIIVSWRGHDEDGDKLTYRLEYSGDGGKTYWHLLDTSRQTVSLDRSRIFASNQARFLVSVSDGTQSTYAESEIFTIANTADVSISFPEYVDTRSFTLTAHASGFNYFDDLHYEWYHSRSGFYGSGTGNGNTNILDVSIPLEHKNPIITVYVADRFGNFLASASIRVIIDFDPNWHIAKIEKIE